MEDVRPDDDSIRKLFVLLNDRVYNISHRSRVSFEEHKKFVLNHPYRYWMFIVIKNKVVGTVYIHFDNSVGLNYESSLTAAQIKNVLHLIFSCYHPLPAIPSVRIGEFHFRIATKNVLFQKIVTDFGFEEVERTYVLAKDSLKTLV